MNPTRNFLILAGLVVALCAPSDVRADFTFGEPVEFGPAVGSSDDIVCFSSDGLEMYINQGLGTGYCDLWVLQRASVNGDWGPPVDLGPAINSPQDDAQASISADGLTFYFQSTRPGGYGATDIYMATRATRKDPWGPAVNIGPTINSAVDDYDVWISANGLELYFASNRSGGYGAGDIWVARRATGKDSWGTPVNLGPVVNSAYNEALPCLSPDGLLLLFQDYGKPRPGGYGGGDFWMTRRASLCDPWQPPVNLGPTVNGRADEFLPRLSPDGRILSFSGTRSGSWDVWQAPILPLVDFNGDEKVDMQDLLRLIESWGQNDPTVDIGPMPWGDGKVDEKDLEVLMSQWGQNVNDSTLIVHWPLDESEGMIVHDRVGANDGTVIGLAQWRPQGGTTGGALELNGKTFVAAKSAMNPAKGPFSIVAWIKGGAPGQTVVSQ